MASPWSALIGAGATLLGGLFSAKSQSQTNQANADQARQQEDFQERMSSTAHQREVKDLEAAGLNPLLSANSGASTPSGAMATFQNPAKDIPESIHNSAKSFAELSLLKETVKTQQTQQELNKANATLANSAASAATGGKLSVPGLGSINASNLADNLKKSSAGKWWQGLTAKARQKNEQTPVSGSRG
ncbi:MAG: DNA pilot protein [Microvirus sp.]|nr:MAG: DNA pilot protein [Microvirus sp.]